MIATQEQQAEVPMSPAQKRKARIRKGVVEEFKDLYSRLPPEILIPTQPIIVYLADKYEIVDDTVRKILYEENVLKPTKKRSKWLEQRKRQRQSFQAEGTDQQQQQD